MRVIILLIALVLTVPFTPAPGFAQGEAVSAAEDARKRSAAVLASLKAILKSKAERATRLEALNEQLKLAGDGEKDALKNQIKTLQAELAQLDVQFNALVTGGASAKFVTDTDQTVDLRKEFEQLLQPLVVMIKMATEDGRQIELLRHSRLLAGSQAEAARTALENLKRLRARSKDEVLKPKFSELAELWQKRVKETSDLVKSLDSQLEAVLKRRASAGTTGQAFTKFLRDRGINLLLALAAVILVFVGLQLIKKFIGGGLDRHISTKRSFRRRLAGLFYQAFTIVAVVSTALYVLNLRNDWLLMVVALLFLLAAGWVFIKMLPRLIEQVALLLDLGAAQEGERVRFMGVPWLIKDLSYYTTLENPALSGGTITLPVRELIGMHSRPLAANEDWFPCREGDWVTIPEKHTGEVMVQSPEMVQLKLLGGAIATYTTEAFLQANPINLSRGFRAEIEFALDYRHQAIATTEVPRKLAAAIEKGLKKLLNEDELLRVEVEFLRAGSSSLDYEVEADIAGHAAHKFEDVERAMAAILVDVCNRNGWVIPFPQLTVHGAALPQAAE